MAKNKNKNNKKPGLAPVKNPELKEALKTLKEERTRENEAAMFAEVKKAKLLAPVLFNVNVDAKNGRINLPENTQIKFVLVNSNTGKSFFPVFTDLDEAKKLPLAPNQHPQYVVRSLKDYERMIDDPNNKAEGIAINPMSDNIILPNLLVKRLNSDEPIIAPVQAAPAPAAVRYTEPAIYPTAVVNAVYETARTMGDIDRVWMKGKLIGTEMSFIFFVAADKKDEDILAALKIAAEPLSKGIPVECAFVDDRIMENVIKDSVALYDREMEF